ncbi:alpha/beta hydrolase [uncultured Polaribacter sp.]|uniref:alpha/beta fold hydrolase n=1 Tax=uncultured Polaribacter sp. TaxID=174711 RepID=UPI00262E27B9|nr:alpha/beta hydrolase [uncultured Polaribacter sp.]
MNTIIKTDFGKIEYSIIGKGKPILFLHGGHSNCHETLFLKGYSTDSFKLIIPSRPGYGETPLGENKQPIAAAKLIISMLNKLDIEKVIIVGISAGGLTAIELTSNFPERVEKLILISAVTKKWLHPKDKMYQQGIRLFSPKREKFIWQLYRICFRFFPNRMAKVLIGELSTKQNPKITKQEIDEIRQMTFNQRSKEGFITDLEQNIDASVIAKIKCPTLILHSKNDKSVSIEMATYANKNIRNSNLKVYANKWGHLLWVGLESEQPISEVNKFINSDLN